MLPVTLAQAVQDAVHFVQRTSREEQERSQFFKTERPANRPPDKTNAITIKRLEDGSEPPQAERPAVGTGKNKFPKKYDPMNQAKKKEGGVRQFKKGVTCYNCGQEGHHFNTCAKPRKERAVTRLAQEKEGDPLVDSPDDESDFDKPALAMILDAHWEAFKDKELIKRYGLQQHSPRAAINVLTDEQLDPRLPRKRTPLPMTDGFVAPVQPSGPNLDPIMAPPPEQRRRDQKIRNKLNSASPQQLTDTPNAEAQPANAGAPLQLYQANQNFPTKWVPTKELNRHCPPNLLNDL
jgi:hypothetical protein